MLSGNLLTDCLFDGYRYDQDLALPNIEKQGFNLPEFLSLTGFELFPLPTSNGSIPF